MLSSLLDFPDTTTADNTTSNTISNTTNNTTSSINTISNTTSNTTANDSLSYSSVVSRSNSSKSSSRSTSKLTTPANSGESLSIHSSSISMKGTSRLTTPTNSNDNLNMFINNSTNNTYTYVSDSDHQYHISLYRKCADDAHKEMVQYHSIAKQVSVQNKGIERSIATIFIDKGRDCKKAKTHALAMASMHTCLLKNNNIALDVSPLYELIFIGFTPKKNTSKNIIDSNSFQIDLHGLTRVDVDSLVPSLLQYIESKNNDTVHLTFITGMGSKN